MADKDDASTDGALTAPGKIITAEETSTSNFSKHATDIGDLDVKDLAIGDAAESKCGACGSETGADGKALSRCMRCKVQSYCSKDCQKLHWPTHKAECKKVAGTSNAEGATRLKQELHSMAFIAALNAIRNCTAVRPIAEKAVDAGKGIVFEPWCWSVPPALAAAMGMPSKFFASPDVKVVRCGYGVVANVPERCFDPGTEDIWDLGAAHALGFPLRMMRVNGYGREVDETCPPRLRTFDEVSHLFETPNPMASGLLMVAASEAPGFAKVEHTLKGPMGLVRSDGADVQWVRVHALKTYLESVAQEVQKRKKVKVGADVTDWREFVSGKLGPKAFADAFREMKQEALAKGRGEWEGVQCPVDPTATAPDATYLRGLIDVASFDSAQEFQ